MAPILFALAFMAATAASATAAFTFSLFSSEACSAAPLLSLPRVADGQCIVAPTDAAGRGYRAMCTSQSGGVFSFCADRNCRDSCHDINFRSGQCFSTADVPEDHLPPNIAAFSASCM
jgi:hypothetical protein